MLKRIITAACFAVLAAGCGTTQGGTSTSSTGSTGTTSQTTGNTNSGTNGTSSTTSQGTTGNTNTGTSGSTSTTSQGTTGNTNSGSSGSSGAVCVPETDVTQVRSALLAGQHALVCLNGVVTVGANLAGDQVTYDGGNGFTYAGSKYNGDYLVADQNANVIHVRKYADSLFTGDPSRGASADVNGKVYSYDGGPNITEYQVLITAHTNTTGQGITTPSATAPSATLPSPKQASSLADLDHTNFASPVIGSYVQVPAGTYTQNDTDPGLQTTARLSDGGSATFQDGFSLSDGTSSVWVDTYHYLSHVPSGHDKSCWPTDGGFLDLHNVQFKGVYDIGRAPNGTEAAVFYLTDCSDLQ